MGKTLKNQGGGGLQSYIFQFKRKDFVRIMRSVQEEGLDNYTV